MLQQLPAQPALIDQVHDRLVAAIITGALAPEQKLTQESVAEMLGVSRQPVSHALQILKRRGLLIEHGKRSLAVAPIDGAMIRHLYQIREALDGLAASLAADRVRQGLVTAAEHQALDQALAHGSGMPATASMIDRVQADVAFHNALNGMSGNPQIATTIAEQWPHFMRSMGVVLQSLGTRARVWQEHAEIADAVLAGDRQRAGKCAREHTRHAGEDTARSIENIPAVA